MDSEKQKNIEAELKIDIRIDLAVERTELALERTHLAWIRTTFTIMTAGIAIEKGLKLFTSKDYLKTKRSQRKGML
jgi:uncharacterized membrane protein YidH (DUF202 family)